MTTRAAALAKATQMIQDGKTDRVRDALADLGVKRVLLLSDGYEVEKFLELIETIKVLVQVKDSESGTVLTYRAPDTVAVGTRVRVTINERWTNSILHYDGEVIALGSDYDGTAYSIDRVLS